MKRYLLPLVLMLLLTGCAGETLPLYDDGTTPRPEITAAPGKTTEVSLPEPTASDIPSSATDAVGLEALLLEQGGFENTEPADMAWVSAATGLDLSLVITALCRENTAGGAEMFYLFEVEPNCAAAAEAACRLRLEQLQLELSQDYPEEYEIACEGRVVNRGGFVILLVHPDAQALEQAVVAAIRGENG